MKAVSTTLRSFALGLAMVGMSMTMFAQSNSKQMPPDTQQSPSTQSPSTDTAGSQASNSQNSMQTFQGTISQGQTGYVLKDSSGVSYQLDDQKKAKEFSGQSVKVSGTLDSSTSTIHVTSISPAS
jgi:hypothetical protein